MKPGGVGAAVLLGDLDRLVDRHLVRHAKPSSISYSATRITLRSSGAIRSTVQPLAWAAIVSSRSSRCGVDALGQFAGQRPGVADQLGQADGR